MNDASARAGSRSSRICPGMAAAVEVRPGDLVSITDAAGKQMAAFVAFACPPFGAYLSVAATRTSNGGLAPRAGDRLLSNRRSAMFELVEDTVGCHDTLVAACDPPRYAEIGEPGHPNCREALADALAPHGIDYDRIPDPINWFMHVAVLPDRTIEIREPLSRPGDRVVLRALVASLVAVAACPHDKNPTNGFAPSDILFRVERAESTTRRGEAT